ncbi:hypothetical protein M8C21_026163 [Ambrosia artemisiifolia]|uniref:Uncharacterized protein n=1 Tax=Ambrosia artemisiifolia TaxID=4212 RepID=A0AAD5CAB4_AMBAR|nr:hypothetical protein M8C21_026163 [Ambrosia artemisiifolia]
MGFCLFLRIKKLVRCYNFLFISPLHACRRCSFQQG